MRKIYTQITKKLHYALVAIMTSSAIVASGQVKMHTIGDSTMQTYDESSTDKRGWAQMLQQFFDVSSIKVNNRGKSGASSKSFYNEAAYWPTLNGGSDCIKNGDFVIIQFAHNDEKTNGTDGDELKAYYTAKGDATATAAVDYRGTTPFDTYKLYLRKYIEDTKKLGGKPILVGPICRKYFSGSAIKRNGRHDLGDNFDIIEDGVLKTKQSLPSTDHTMDYVYQMKSVASEYDDVPFIDLTTATAEMYLSYGEAFCTQNLFCSDDNTHPAAMGATLIARLFAQLVKNQAEGGEPDDVRRAVLQQLASSVIISSDVNFSPSSGDLGQTYQGQTVVKEFNVSAFGLNPSSGKFTFTANGDILLSVDKSTYSSSVSVDYDGSTLISPLYVKVEAVKSGDIYGSISASNGSITKTLDVKLSSVSISGGVPVSVLWPLTSSADPIVEGPVTAVDESFSGCYVKNYSAINSAAVWPETSGYTATHVVQRVCVNGDAWPAGEIDEVSTRYVQFGVEAPAGAKIAINNISMYVAGAGGNGMRCKIYYSTDPTFSKNTQIVEMKSMTSNNAYEIAVQPTLSISDGEKLYLRIYPWYSSSATGKTICFSDVKISGVSLSDVTSNVAGSSDDASVLRVEYYDINGRMLSKPVSGINIMRIVKSDGSVVSCKIRKI